MSAFALADEFRSEVANVRKLAKRLDEELGFDVGNRSSLTLRREGVAETTEPPVGTDAKRGEVITHDRREGESN